MNAQAEVLSIFKNALMLPNLELKNSMVTGDLPGWDSFKNVEILLACEKAMEIRFRSKEIDAIRTVGDLIQMCEMKLSSAASR